MQRRFDQAVDSARHATTVNPNYALGYMMLSEALSNSGQPVAAISAAEQGMRLDPASQDFYAVWIGIAYVVMGRYREAVPFLKRAIAAFPNDIVAHLDLAMAYTELGQDEDARAEAAEVMRINPHFAIPPPEKGFAKDVALNKRFQDDLRKAGLK
jgi:tetratricopeptide (TPR) repeat protein